MFVWNKNPGKWIQFGGGVLLIGFAVFITGCGSATTSMAGGASNPTVSIVNANPQDIEFLKNIDGRYTITINGNSASATSVTHTSSVGRIMTIGTVGMVFNSTKLNEFIASKGLSTFAYIQHQYSTNRGFTGWYGDQNEYFANANQSIYYKKTAPTSAESCTTCYHTHYNDGTYTLNEEKCPTTSSVSIIEYSGDGGNLLGKLLYLELKQYGYTLALSHNGTYTVGISSTDSTPTLRILTFGPFLLEKNGQKYVLVNKTTLPRIVVDNLIVTMEIQNMLGQIIGEADVVGSGQINFKVYVNGVLTSVNSLN